MRGDVVSARRATTTATKRALVERLLAAWALAPALRLGQLIENATERARHADGEAVDLFGVEDEDLVEILERSTAPAGTLCGARDPADPDGRTCVGDAEHKSDHTDGAARWVRR